MSNVRIIGVGPYGLDELKHGGLKDIIEGSDIVIGSKRLLDLLFPKGKVEAYSPFDSLPVERYHISDNMDEIGNIIRDNPSKRIAVLATGDPNLYGIAETIFRYIPKEDVEIYPAVSYMQIAFARIKETMNDSIIISLHGRDGKDFIKDILKNKKIGIFLDHKNNPLTVINELLTLRIFHYDVYVCEDLSTEKECITKIDIKNLSTKQGFSPNSIMILIKIDTKDGSQACRLPFGINDNIFFYKNNMITKSEIRAVAISKLSVLDGNVIWDIGAGCGAISVEIINLFPGTKVFAIEKDHEQIEFLQKNLNAFSIKQVEVIRGEAPYVLEQLPNPDRVVIGGSGCRLPELLDYIDTRLSVNGVVVINAVSFDTLENARYRLKCLGYGVDIVLLSISKNRHISSNKEIFSAFNPVFILSGKRHGR